MSRLNLSKVNFTKKADTVKSDDGIFNPKHSNINTFKGDDTIIGTGCVSGDFGFGILVGVKVEDLSSIIASATFSQRINIRTKGIENKGCINTGDGDDLVSGSATANISVTAATVSQAIAIAQKADATVISNAFASIKVNVTANGIDNSGGKIDNGKGNDGIEGNVKGSIAAVAIAIVDVSGIVEAICQTPISEGLTAFAGAMATSLAKAKITATGIKNIKGIITTGEGADTISATATSSSATLSVATASSLSSATPENQALAQAVAYALAQAKDTAIAIDNTRGYINTSNGKDNIFAKATGSESYGIFGGIIDMGNGNDRIEASSFGGGVNITMGKGNDFVQGFGDATVDGSAGFDTLSLGSYNKSDFHIYMNNGCTVFELGGITMNTTGFENYIFADGNCRFDIF